MAPTLDQKELLSRAEDVADDILRYSKHFLPHVARLCLVSTFIEDGIRMWFQWSDQRDYMNITWGIGWFLSTFFVLYNLLGQIGGSVMVMLRIRVEAACGLLFSIVVVQSIAYNILWDWQFLMSDLD